MTGASAETKPNVVLITTTQQRWDTLGTYGNPMTITPTLDALARKGTKLGCAVTPQPLDSPALAALQTGKYATSTGVWRNDIELEGERTLGHEFSEAGYDVGFVGRWHLGGTSNEFVPQHLRGGYDDFWIGANSPEFLSQPESGFLFDRSGNRVEYNRYRTDAFTGFAEEAIDQLAEPFLLAVSYVEPHHQNDMGSFVPPEGYAELFERNTYVPPDLMGRPGDWYGELPNYYGMIKRIDECVARLREKLGELGVWEDTILAFTSGYGCHFRTRAGEYKRTPHESSIRVPAIFTGPGFDRGRTINETTSLIDIAPTLLDAAGIDVPDQVHGRSLLPRLRGEPDPRSRDDVFVQISASSIGRAIRTDQWKYSVAAPKTSGWRGGYGEPSSDVYAERYLYDLKRDPTESVNLIGRPDFASEASKCRNILRKYIRTVEDETPEILKYDDPGYPDY